MEEYVVLIDANGRTSIQKNEEEDKEPSITTNFSKTDKNSAPESYQQEQQSKNQANPSLEETNNENHKLKETPEKAGPLIAADKIVTDISSTTYDKEVNIDNDILSYEFSMPFKKVRNYVTSLLSKMGNDEKVLVLPSEIVKSLRINPMAVFMLLKVNERDVIELKIIREDLTRKMDVEKMTPVEKVPRLAQQVAEAD